MLDIRLLRKDAALVAERLAARATTPGRKLERGVMHGFRAGLAGRAVSLYTSSVLNFILVGVIDDDGAFQPRSGAWSIWIALPNSLM
ncbi:hypothetical protein [Thiobacillus sp.]|uniref:hypothetical protein n=1 Tax=Thiobacillus sp. TaxID=924 RepID=UPI0025D2943D|nr:hypothetical protein [Thiobacillus sp.]